MSSTTCFGSCGYHEIDFTATHIEKNTETLINRYSGMRITTNLIIMLFVDEWKHCVTSFNS